MVGWIKRIFGIKPQKLYVLELENVTIYNMNEEGLGYHAGLVALYPDLERGRVRPQRADEPR